MSVLYLRNKDGFFSLAQGVGSPTGPHGKLGISSYIGENVNWHIEKNDTAFSVTGLSYGGNVATEKWV